MANLNDADSDRGLYDKFIVQRADGSSGAGGRHENCQYFVLDLNHDPFARMAISAYAEACEHTHPVLSRDIWRLLNPQRTRGK